MWQSFVLHNTKDNSNVLREEFRDKNSHIASYMLYIIGDCEQLLLQ